MDAKTKELLYIAGAVLLLLLIIGFVIYRSGKKSGKAEGVINLSNPVSDNTSSNAPAASTSEISQLAQAVYADMSGVNFLGHDIDLWGRVLALSDQDFTRLYNEFNLRFQKSTGESMTKWVENEYAYDPYTPWNAVRKTVLAKMAKLKFV